MFLYNTVISLYFTGIRIAALFNPKIKLLAKGQRGWKDDLDKKLKPLAAFPKLWIHCASVGEFEQGRPLIEALRREFPDFKIVLSFFSPSGYELHKNYPQADAVVYLPKDTKANAAAFIDRVQPRMAVFVKYEFWLNFLFALRDRSIPTYLVSAVIKEHQPFFKWYGKPFVKALHTYKAIFVQDERSLQLLQKLGAATGVLSGDTRIDRVIAISRNARELPEIRDFAGRSTVIMAGSTWKADEDLLLKAYAEIKQKHPGTKLIITPHEVDRQNIGRLQNDLEAQHLDYALYTSGGNFNGKDVLVIDTIGLLSSLYRYGRVAYIGGGFSNGIHNILEPAVFGLPVLFGPRHSKFNEARSLLATGAATEIHTVEELSGSLDQYLASPALLEKKGRLCLDYITANQGATEKILRAFRAELGR